ncbi:excinuclease ABC subunit A [Candidatus Woesebacteria bacterium RBG_16_34_12]|uniref:UvrABC system protein A n=1 Tax=Candidatus Woesebacteria bacterium RBG_16_34_12 TaxID=1802480 RepID=A0A1F7XCA4_9BACT|nr:MAG: excinuclease ABC subunit A [Candidatus Woesebacteria bacterium RBG_16_34_12]
MKNFIKIRGVRVHNLKNINVDIPKNKLVVLTGVSGSGKSSLAYDTIYAEGQRRYVESLSTYARQFLGIMEKPDVDAIEGLSPAISIDQKTTSRNPRSTVGTVTEIYDYFRLLYARIGHPHCPKCGREISSQSLDQIVSAIIEIIKRNSKEKKISRYIIYSPIVRDKKGEFSQLFNNLKAKGYKQVRIDNQVRDLSEDLVLIKTNRHTIEVIIDRITINSKDFKDKIYEINLQSRINDSCEQGLKISEGQLILSQVVDQAFDFPKQPKKVKDFLFSEKFSCPFDNLSLPEIEPRTFSFNSPHGACRECSGLGKILKVDEKLIFTYEISITEGAILPFSTMFEHDTWYSRLIMKICEENSINPRIPLKNLTKENINILLYGTGDRIYKVEGLNKSGHLTNVYWKFIGIIAELERRYKQTESDWIRKEIEKYMREQVCFGCNGKRLKPESLKITIDNRSIFDATSNSIKETILWINQLIKRELILNEREVVIANPILKEIKLRLEFLISVGLEYLSLDRASGTLSVGEGQRIRLASQIGSGLTGVLYILDEPTVGLHARDNQKLIMTLKKLRDLGNSVIVVEHDSEMIKNADYIIDFGPGAGKFGGTIVAKGKPNQIYLSNKSLTGKYISGKVTINISDKNIVNDKSLKLVNNFVFDSEKSKAVNHQFLNLIGSSQYNLKNINVKFPLGKLVVITGVSGSGKSTLLVETLYPALVNYFNPLTKLIAGKHLRLEGTENVDKVILIDQSPIGKTPRSNPATYTKLFDYIRDVFATTRESKASGFKKGRFSFNVKGGRCEACEGQGKLRIEMQFMSDIWVNCEVCGGSRYNSQTLEIEYKGKNIQDVLNMTVNEAKEFFHSHSLIMQKLETLEAVGMGYIELGQSSTILSGGESQRIKLARELSKKPTGNTIYILDEPTTGLHFADIEKLLIVLKLLVAKGNSVFIIEHNLDVIKNADWIIDLGPEGGEMGGYLVAEGTLQNIKYSKNSFTGKYI